MRILGFDIRTRPKVATSSFHVRECYGGQLDQECALSLSHMFWHSDAEEWPSPNLLSFETVDRRLRIAHQHGVESGPSLNPGKVMEGVHHRTSLQAPLLTSLAYWGRRAVGVARVSASAKRPAIGALRLWVLPESRRIGIAKALLKSVVAHARKYGMTTIETRTLSSVPAGEVLVRRVGGSKWRTVFHMQTPAEVERTLSTAGDSDSGIHFQILSGECQPDDLLEAIVRLKGLVSARYGTSHSSGSLAHRTQSLRRQRRLLAELGYELWTVSATAPNGDCVGYSEYLWDPEQPMLLKHVDLAVTGSYRGGYVARKLVECRRRLIDMRPTVSLVRYSRLRSGVSSSTIQNVHHAETNWSVDLDRLEASI